MVDERPRRRLTAILSADVKGYSRLMEEDELETIRTLETYRGIMEEIIRNFDGRVVDAPGDNLLAEFSSVVHGVESATEIQKELRSRNADLPERRRMQFRIGINLGDVIEEGDRIYGDGVNVAARIQGLAEGGGICISGTVYDHIEGKLALKYDYLGERSVKNMRKPVRVYQVLMGQQPSPESQLAEFSDRATIAVLPFVNMSGDSEQEYFSDGITEDLITDLSKIPGLFVIARNSVFTYKNKPVTAQQVSRDLGVRYLLEGSVRKGGERVRITAQFIDAITGGHLWAERYDRDIGDIFALQDEVTRRIVAVLAVKIGEEAHKQVAARGTRNVAAYDLFLRGLEYFNQYAKEANVKARAMFRQALDLDPEYAIAYEKTGWTHFMDWTLGWSNDIESLNDAYDLAKKATSLDDSAEGSHCLLGNVYLWRKQHEKAIELHEKSLTLNPNYANGFSDLGSVLCFAGRPDEAIEMIEKTIRLDPFFPYHFFYLGHAYLLTRRYDAALDALQKALDGNPDFFPARAFRAVVYVELEREEEARSELAVILQKSPGTTTAIWRERLPYKNAEDLDRVLLGLKKAGMP